MKTAQNTLVKNSSFAKWRYNAPGREYHFLTIRKDGYLVAFVSYRNIIKKNVPSLGLLDFIVLPEHRNCIGLINHVPTIVNYSQKDMDQSILKRSVPINNQQSTTDNQQSTINDQRSTINDRQSTINNQQSTIITVSPSKNFPSPRLIY